jgi:hypothetical protein
MNDQNSSASPSSMRNLARNMAAARGRKWTQSAPPAKFVDRRVFVLDAHGDEIYGFPTRAAFKRRPKR